MSVTASSQESGLQGLANSMIALPDLSPQFAADLARIGEEVRQLRDTPPLPENVATTTPACDVQSEIDLAECRSKLDAAKARADELRNQLDFVNRALASLRQDHAGSQPPVAPSQSSVVPPRIQRRRELETKVEQLRQMLIEEDRLLLECKANIKRRHEERLKLQLQEFA